MTKTNTQALMSVPLLLLLSLSVCACGGTGAEPLPLSASKALPLAACAISFEDTGEHFVDPYHTPNARLRVRYLTDGCEGAPMFQWTGGGGYSVYPTGSPNPGVFWASLVAQAPGGPYIVTAMDGAGRGGVTLAVYIEEEQ